MLTEYDFTVNYLIIFKNIALITKNLGFFVLYYKK